MNIKVAISNEEIEDAISLFESYYQSVGFDPDRAVTTLFKDIERTGGKVLIATSGLITTGAVSYVKLERNIAEIRALFVKKDERRNGIGSALVKYTLDLLKNEAVTTVKLYTLPVLREAIRLYDKHGFKITEPYKRGMLKETIFMKMNL
jgi:GNAT superfamily N-acetyltransferase